jgi:D-3-phosphoglycerate dehydrogenase / 2-oxoglutarate reductase
VSKVPRLGAPLPVPPVVDGPARSGPARSGPAGPGPFGGEGWGDKGAGDKGAGDKGAGDKGAAVVVGLGPVDPALVRDALGAGAVFVAEPGEEALRAAQGAIVRATFMVDDALLERMPELKVLARTGVGVDLVDLDAADRRGIAVAITPGSGSAAVAEGVIAMALYFVKRLGPLTALVREGRWQQRATVPVGDLEGATFGIVGYGRIGSRVAALARAFGSNVLAFDPLAPPPAEIACSQLGRLAAQSDVISLHVPLTEATRHMVSSEFLAGVKPGAALINCGRGALIDLDAVAEALDAGRLSGVGLDVFDPEPPAHHRLFDHQSVLLTPHVMGLSRRATAATFAHAASAVAAVLAGKRPAALANPGWRAPAPGPSPALSKGASS